MRDYARVRDRIDRQLGEWIRFPGEPPGQCAEPTRPVVERVLGCALVVVAGALLHGITPTGTVLDAAGILLGLGGGFLGIPWSFVALAHVHTWWATRRYPRYGGHNA